MNKIQIKVILISFGYFLACAVGDITSHFLTVWWELMSDYSSFEKKFMFPLFNVIWSGYISYKFNYYLLDKFEVKTDRYTFLNNILVPTLVVIYMLYIEIAVNYYGLDDDWKNGFVILLSYVFFTVALYLKNLSIKED